LGGLNFILPDFITNKVRTAMILDAGNIYQTNHVAGISYENVSFSTLRVTTGVMVSWWSPLGAPLDFSLAVPLNKKPGDQLSIFGFSFGATL
jgi:outer membrane protein insertion porin family